MKGWSSLKCCAIFCLMVILVKSAMAQKAAIDVSGDVSGDVSVETTVDTSCESVTAEEGVAMKVTENLQNSVVDRDTEKFCICDCDTGAMITEGHAEKDKPLDQMKETTINILNEIEPTVTIGLDSVKLKEIEDTINSNIDELQTPTTAASNPEETESGEGHKEADATATVTDLPTSTKCDIEGDFVNENNCHAYFTCASSSAGSQQRIDKLCPPKLVFSMELGRCTRDITACNDSIVCTVAGTFADNNTNASYYWCVPRLLGGFRLYHIDCKVGRVFVPQLGKCFIDINNLQQLPKDYNEDAGKIPDDEGIVKAELKLLKAADKLKLKEQKLKKKLENKLKKEQAKKAAKEAKEQAKLKNASKEYV